MAAPSEPRGTTPASIVAASDGLVSRHALAVALAVVTGAGLMTLGVAAMAPIFYLLAAALAVRGVAVHRSATGAGLVNLAWDQISRGKLSDARATLDFAASRWTLAYLEQAADLCRARIAFRQGALDEVLAHTTRAATRRGFVLGRRYRQGYVDSARGLRALVRALRGEAVGAREDAAAVRTSPDAGADALVRAELAEAIVLERSGDRAALARHLAAHRWILSNSTSPRERAIVRALHKLLRSKQASVYREAPPPDARSDGEPTTLDWLGMVAPEVAPFARIGGRVVVDPRVEAPADPRLQAAAAARAMRRRASSRPIGFSVAFAGVVVAFVASLLPVGSGNHVFRVLPAFLGVFLLPTVMIVLTGRRLRRSARSVRDDRALRRTLRKAARGDASSEAEFAALERSPAPLVGAFACLQLAFAHERRGAFEEALAACDRGLELAATSRTTRLLASSVHTPELLAERALVLAAMGRDDEASAEFAHLRVTFPGFSSLARAERRFNVVLEARRGDFARAAAFASDDVCDAPIPARDDLLGELLRVVASTHPRDEDRAFVREVLRTDATSRAWIAAIAPDALHLFDGARCGVVSSVGAADDAEAELEALAVEEAAAAEVATSRA